MDFLGERDYGEEKKLFMLTWKNTIKGSLPTVYSFRETRFVCNHKYLRLYKMRHYKHEYMRLKILSRDSLCTTNILH